MLKYILPAVLLVSVPVGSAFADRDRHDRGWRHESPRRQHVSRPRTVVSFNFRHPSYYHPRSYYHAPRVVYVPQPQVIYLNDNNSRAVDNDDGRYCREYQSVARIGGTSRQTYGTACLEPDGSWEIQS